MTQPWDHRDVIVRMKHNNRPATGEKVDKADFDDECATWLAWFDNTLDDVHDCGELCMSTRHLLDLALQMAPTLTYVAHGLSRVAVSENTTSCQKYDDRVGQRDATFFEVALRAIISMVSMHDDGFDNLTIRRTKRGYIIEADTNIEGEAGHDVVTIEQKTK